MITKIYKSVDIKKSIFTELDSKFHLDLLCRIENLESKFHLDLLCRVENSIWNNSQAHILQDYLKRNQQMLFGTYLNKPLTKV